MPRPITILLLDDDPEFHEIFEDFIDLALNGRTFNLFTATDIDTAIGLAMEFQPQVIFADYRLGAETGIEFLRRYSMTDGTASRILLTGYGSEDAEEEALAAGAVDFLPKDDISPESLARALRYSRAIQDQRNEMALALRQVRNASAVKSNFLSNMSHELRTPLNGIVGFTELLLMKYADAGDEALAKYLEGIHESGRRLSELVENLLVLGGQTDRSNLHPANIGLRPFFDEITDRARTNARARGVAFSFALPDDADSVWSDIEVLTFALRPIIDNAVKFTDRGGEVTINVVIGKVFMIEISDTGIGMDEETLKDALTPFFQQDTSLTRVYEGAGIGLSVAKNAIELLGGKLAIMSAPGKGTAITVSLPYLEQTAVAAE